MAGWALTAVACESSPPSAPTTAPFADAAAVDGAATALAAAVNTPALRSLAALGRYMTLGAPAAAPWSGPTRAACSIAATRDAATPPAPSAAAYPDSLKGRILVFEVDSARYQTVADSGGPADGVRYLLTALDQFGNITDSLGYAGWFDLHDLSAAGAPTMHGQLVAGTTLNTDYTAAPTGSQSSWWMRLDGQVTGAAATPYAFHDSATGAGAVTTVALQLASPDSGIAATLVASHLMLDFADSRDTFDFRFARGPDTIAVTGGTFTYCFYPSTDVSIAIDGVPFAAGSGLGGAPPSLARTDSLPLTTEQSDALLALIDLRALLFSWQSSIATPARLMLGP